MLPDAQSYPLDAEDYSFSEEPVPLGPNLAANAARDGFIFLFASVAVLLAVFMLSVLFSTIAKHLSLWRVLSFLILFASFTPALLDFSAVRSYLVGVTGEPEATIQRIDQAIAEFTALTFWCAAVLLIVCVFAVWRLPWTTVTVPPVVSLVYFLLPYRQLERTIYGTYVPIDGLLHLLPVVVTLLLCALALGWLWGGSPKNPLLIRLRA